MSCLFPLSSPLARLAYIRSDIAVQGIRFKGNLAPKRSKYRKAHKGRVPIRLGGSTKGSTVEIGDFGLRALEPVRLSAKQLSTADEAVKKGLKVVKGARSYLRLFPDIPVCVKGNETRMGKGKGTFEYWACRVPMGKVIIEVGGAGLRAEIAQSILRIAAHKLPIKTEFVSKGDLGRLGNVNTARQDVFGPSALDHSDVPTLPAVTPATEAVAVSS